MSAQAQSPPSAASGKMDHKAVSPWDVANWPLRFRKARENLRHVKHTNGLESKTRDVSHQDLEHAVLVFEDAPFTDERLQQAVPCRQAALDKTVDDVSLEHQSLKGRGPVYRWY
ncbi:MAG: hypothetical protein ACRD8O_14635, partial [Bryobacteraceae bacterium]